ncbi:MAG TPA: plastocyanin/azurin family copper-binding protein [Gemmatimonadaceae bacterium]|nr:plastocyanin/azurin family copper-binding protein [Gemmatimonadaceae bacterium]
MHASIRCTVAPNHRVVRLAAVCLTLAACGGEPKSQAAESANAAATAATPAATTPAPVTPAPAAAPAAAEVAITGKTHEVRMIGDATGYRFDPVNLTIKAGDGVRWTFVSGGPHNVSFWADSIPGGAAAQLNAAMAKQMSPLTGPLMLQPNETYTISFGGAAKGTYRYFCTPHLALGMKGTITVQ